MCRTSLTYLDDGVKLIMFGIKLRLMNTEPALAGELRYRFKNLIMDTNYLAFITIHIE